ncbi:MAG: AbrB/MazE/SpoVT family DNA-binding domain-containing protein [Thermoplasmatota archaeon]
MEIAVTTISRNGQIVIPSDIRKALDIKAYEKFLVFGEGDSIIMKRLDREAMKREFKDLMDTFGEAFSTMNISAEDVETEIKGYRSSKKRAKEDSA